MQKSFGIQDKAIRYRYRIANNLLIQAYPELCLHHQCQTLNLWCILVDCIQKQDLIWIFDFAVIRRQQRSLPVYSINEKLIFRLFMGPEGQQKHLQDNSSKCLTDRSPLTLAKKTSFSLCPTSVLGLELGVDFTFAQDNKNRKNAPLNFLKGTIQGDKGQWVGIRDNGQG